MKKQLQSVCTILMILCCLAFFATELIAGPPGGAPSHKNCQTNNRVAQTNNNVVEGTTCGGGSSGVKCYDIRTGTYVECHTLTSNSVRLTYIFSQELTPHTPVPVRIDLVGRLRDINTGEQVGGDFAASIDGRRIYDYYDHTGGLGSHIVGSSEVELPLVYIAPNGTIPEFYTYIIEYDVTYIYEDGSTNNQFSSFILELDYQGGNLTVLYFPQVIEQGVASNFVLYPNPTSDGYVTFKFDVAAINGVDGLLVIYDFNGTDLDKLTFTKPQGDNQSITYFLGDYVDPRGKGPQTFFYRLILANSDGNTHEESGKLIFDK